MNWNEDIRSISELKKRPAALLGAVNRNRRPMVITQKGKACAVVQDIATFESHKKALLLLKLTAQSEQQIAEGQFIKQSDVFKRLKKKFKENA